MEKFKQLTSEELKKWMDEGKEFALFDVLPKESYEVRHLPGAKNADVGQPDFLQKVSEAVGGDKSKTVVVYCASFTCQASPKAAGILANDGYMNVYDFKGGLADWQDGGFEFEGETTDSQPK